MAINYKKPELLAPAGDMECLEAAVKFGADAVYLAGTEFGMRTAAKNFTYDLLKEAVKFSHSRGVKVYLTCNTVPRNDEICHLPDFIKNTAECGIDAFIVTDIGVLGLIKKIAPQSEVHISTQAGITNYLAANAFFDMGASRVVTARELSIDEVSEIRKNIPSEKEIECFVHGAMCMSFSGRCMLSSYLTGRDSNRGDCAQPCRWKYNVVEETRPGEYFPISEDKDGTYIFNAKDMCMINNLPELIKAGVSSFKIEGRAKSAYYVSTITNAYRCAIDAFFENPTEDFKPENWISDEMLKVSHRQYCTGFFFGSPKKNAQIFNEGCYQRDWDVCAISLGSEGGYAFAEQRNRFFEGDEIEILEPRSKPYSVKVMGLSTVDGEPLEAVPHAKMHFKFKIDRPVSVDAIFRKRR